MTTKRLKVTFALLACVAPAAGQTITALPTFGPNGGTNLSHAVAVSSDGQIVGGQATAPGTVYACRWTPAGMQNCGVLPGGTFSVGHDMSADGNWMTGWGDSVNGYRSFRWFSNGSLTDLGSYAASHLPAAISDDGMVIAGDASDQAGPIIYRWTQAGGFQPLGQNQLGMGAYDISGDGSTVVGYSNGINAVNPIRWTQSGGLVVLPLLPGGTHARAWAASYDGSVIAGESNKTSSFGVSAVRWVNGIPQDLGFLAGYGVTFATTIHSSGPVLAGDCGSFSNNDAWVWTEPRGIMLLTDYLSSEGVDLSGWSGLKGCTGISDDGTALVGYGIYQGEDRGFVVRNLPPLCGPWIADHPVSQAVCFDGTTALTLIAYGPTSELLPSIQWQKWNGSTWVDLVDGPTALGTQISGVYSYLLTLASCNTDAAGDYRAAVYAGCSVGYTNSATITVNMSGPNILGHPQGAQVCPEDSATFTFIQFNQNVDMPFTYQWQYETTPGNFTPLPDGTTTVWDGNLAGIGGIVSGANTPTLTIAADGANARALGAAHYRDYRCVVTNACATVATNPATLKIFTSCTNADMNGDQSVDFFDIDGFLLALFNPAGYAAAYPEVNPDNADCNDDGTTDFFDIDAFVACLFGTCP